MLALMSVSKLQHLPDTSSCVLAPLASGLHAGRYCNLSLQTPAVFPKNLVFSCPTDIVFTSLCRPSFFHIHKAVGTMKMSTQPSRNRSTGMNHLERKKRSERKNL